MTSQLPHHQANPWAMVPVLSQAKDETQGPQDAEDPKNYHDCNGSTR